MKKAAWITLAAAAITGAAQAQSQPESAYWGGAATWKNSSGQCWRGGYWSPQMASPDCDPDLAPKPAPVAAPAPAPAPVAPRAAPAPEPAPAPVAAPAPKPVPLSVTLTDTFASNSAVITPAMRKKIDSEVLAKLGQFSSIDSVRVEGHTDRLGSDAYNRKLSQRRADAVASYLASKGVDRSKIQSVGSGKAFPVKSCPDQKNRKALASCLTPNRRVTVDVTGTPKQ
ncbi:MAG: OmpA family protein [Betaproteobacteria bacterium]|nr:OmpA family protein [Betaproteobacteria bacterium]